MTTTTHELTKLSTKHQLFADGIIEHNNQTKAAADAGYSAKSARNAGCRLMKNSNIKDYLRQIKSLSAEKAGVTQDYVVSNLKELVARCMQHAPVLDKKGDQVFMESPEGRLVPVFMFNPSGAAKGLELLGKSIGTFDSDRAREDERPAFVGITINGGSFQISSGKCPPEKANEGHEDTHPPKYVAP